MADDRPNDRPDDRADDPPATMADDGFAERVSGLASLAEPVRLELYRYVAAQPQAVGRDDAADGIGVPRHTAKFHLDKLVDEGLLEVEFRRLTGREGPGAGRPAKLYRRSAREVSVTVPDREYQLAGQLMAAAIERAAGDDPGVVTSLHDVARDRGRDLGRATRRTLGSRPSRAAVLRAAGSALASSGYEPRVEGDRIVLGNCPFHALARDHTALVCGMNLALLGELAEHSHERLSAALEPGEGRCCVTLSWN
jgi:predicted ArsR family transcriptional regulator